MGAGYEGQKHQNIFISLSIFSCIANLGNNNNLVSMLIGLTKEKVKKKYVTGKLPGSDYSRILSTLLITFPNKLKLSELLLPRQKP